MGIVSSTLEYTVQADGSKSVVERHTDSNGKTYDFVYFAPVDLDIEAVKNARATRISSELEAAAVAELEAQNGSLPLTHLEFMLRFTMEERMAIRSASDSDPVIFDFLELLKLSTYIYPHHTLTQVGLGYLTSRGLLTSERATIIGSV